MEAPTRPCLRCGYCCHKAPCPFGALPDEALYQFSHGPCIYLSGPGPGRYSCSIADYIRTQAKSDLAPAFGAGCCSPLNSTRREVARRISAGDRTHKGD